MQTPTLHELLVRSPQEEARTVRSAKPYVPGFAGRSFHHRGEFDQVQILDLT